jgi:hypothetical protein
MIDNKKLENVLMQVNLFGTYSYTSIGPKGLPKLTLFTNLPTPMTESIRNKWEESLPLASLNPRCVLHPHYSLVGRCLLEMLSDIKCLEIIQVMLVGHHAEIWASKLS